MWKLLGKVLLVGVVISFAYVNSYAGDKDHYYQGPNYDDPTAPNYMGGTRTDMAPKVDVPTIEEEKGTPSTVIRPWEPYEDSSSSNMQTEENIRRRWEEEAMPPTGALDIITGPIRKKLLIEDTDGYLKERRK